MQDSQKISQIAYDYATKEESNMKKFNKESLIKRFQQETTPREFYDSYKVLFWIAIVLAFIMQLASATSAYNYIDQIIAIKIAQIDLRLILVLATLVFVEVIKYHLYSITLQKAFARPRAFEPFLILLTLAVSAFSFFASVSGGGEYGVDHKKEKTRSNYYDKKISEVKSQIQEIQNSEAYKVVKWIGNGQTALVLSPEGLKLIQKREAELSEFKQEKAQQLQKINQENSTNRKRYEYAFGTFEIIFILCQLFIWHFKRSSAQDREISEQINSSKANPHFNELKNDGLQKVLQNSTTNIEELLKRTTLDKHPTLNLTSKLEPLTIKKVNPTLVSDQTKMKYPLQALQSQIQILK